MDSLLFMEMAATGFYALIFFVDLVKKQLPTRRTMFFQLFLCALMLNAFFSLDVSIARQFGKSVVLYEAVQVISLFMGVSCCIFLHMHILATVYKLGSNPVTMFIFGVIPNSILTVFVLFSPFFKLAYWFDKAGVMHRTTLFVVGGCIILFNLSLDISLVWRFNKRATPRRKLLYSLLIVIYMIAIVMEIFGLPYFSVWHICMVFFIYAYYLTQQSPDFYVDNVTGFFNRNAFGNVLYERIQYKIPTSCLLVRVAKYDSMNQIYSAEVLQKIQTEIGKIILRNSRDTAVYHISQSTFGVILRSRSDAEVIYYRIKQSLEHTWNLDGTLVNHEYCFYEVTYPEYGTDYDEIVQKIHYARSDHDTHHKLEELEHLKEGTVKEAAQKQEVSHLIEEAIMDNTLEIHFQPIFSFEKGNITSLEVLARLKNKKRQYIDPEFFIRIAEENHTIIELGLQVFRKACMFASRNHIFDKGIENISINLSPAQCRYAHLTEELVEIASQYQVPMERFQLEITESEFVDKKAVAETLHRLKETGAKVALDDFGTGFSTLSNIMDLPVDYVKIDKSLVWSFAEGKNQFLNDLMPMIKAEGKKIVAEGIESADHIDIIKKLQGDYLQGYYYSKPLPEEELLRYLDRFNSDGEKGQEDNPVNGEEPVPQTEVSDEKKKSE